MSESAWSAVRDIVILSVVAISMFIHSNSFDSDEIAQLSEIAVVYIAMKGAEKKVVKKA